MAIAPMQPMMPMPTMLVPPPTPGVALQPTAQQLGVPNAPVPLGAAVTPQQVSGQAYAQNAGILPQGAPPIQAQTQVQPNPLMDPVFLGSLLAQAGAALDPNGAGGMLGGLAQNMAFAQQQQAQQQALQQPLTQLQQPQFAQQGVPQVQGPAGVAPQQPQGQGQVGQMNPLLNTQQGQQQGNTGNFNSPSTSVLRSVGLSPALQSQATADASRSVQTRAAVTPAAAKAKKVSSVQKGKDASGQETLFTMYNDGSTEPLEYVPISTGGDDQYWSNTNHIDDPNNPGKFIQQRVVVKLNKKTGVVSEPIVIPLGPATQMTTSDLAMWLQLLHPDKVGKTQEQDTPLKIDSDFE